MKTQANLERGSALFALLFSLVLIGGLIHGLSTYATHYTKLAATYHNGVTAREQVRAGIRMARSSSRGCSESRIDGDDSAYRTVVTCTLGEPPFRFEPGGQDFSGRPDYGVLFAGAITCPGTVRPETVRNFTAPISPERCVVPLLTSDTTMTYNIEAEAIQLQGQAHVARISTTGEFVVMNTLTTDADVLIVAGGTIRIPAIVTSSTTLVRVTLLSAHGDIEVRATSPNISLLSIGRRLIAVPSTAATTGHPLPPMTSAGISGVVL